MAPLPIIKVYMTERQFCDDNKVVIIESSDKLVEEMGEMWKFQLWVSYDGLVVCLVLDGMTEVFRFIQCCDYENDQKMLVIDLCDELSVMELAEELAYKLPIHANRIRDSIAAGETITTFIPRPGKRAY